MQIETVALTTLILDPANARVHPINNVEGIKGSLQKFGQQKPVVVGENDVVIAGNGTVIAARELGWETLEITRSTLVGSDATAYGIADNATGESSEWENARLAALIDGLRREEYEVAALGMSDERLAEILANSDAEHLPKARSAIEPEEARKTLAERFGVPPFSVLDAKQGYWQTRKNAWLALGLRSFEGRGQNLAYDNAGAKPPSFYALRNEMRAASGVDPTWEQINAEAARRGMMSAAVEGTSIFDPVLCELCYRWFCPTGGAILDPFAGGSVRGLVAAKLGRHYLGIDLRHEQVEANKESFVKFGSQSVVFNGSLAIPAWIEGDSREVLPNLEEGAEFDFVFSCPPYADLEQYSEDARDLSNMDYDEFLVAYRQIIAASVTRLKQNRFACFVVGDVRDGKGIYRNFVAHTIQAFEDAGARLYNDAILLTQVSSAAVRAGRAFEASRKLCKVHQNCLVFVKGDAKKATEAIGACEWGELVDENAPAQKE